MQQVGENKIDMHFQLLPQDGARDYQMCPSAASQNKKIGVETIVIVESDSSDFA